MTGLPNPDFRAVFESAPGLYLVLTTDFPIVDDRRYERLFARLTEYPVMRQSPRPPPLPPTATPDRTEYVDKGMQYYEDKHRQQQIRLLKQKAARRGLQIVQPDAA